MLSNLRKMSINNAHARWAFNVTSWHPTEKEISLAISCVQPEEKTRISKFVFQKDFKSSLIGRLLMRKFVNLATSVPYKEIIFSRDMHGKPYCSNNLPNFNFDFNVSHQGDYVVLAGEIGLSKIGIDVMKMEYTGGKNLNDFFRLMNRTFSLEEWETIKHSNNERKQIEMFCRHWCLKESYVKNVGVGITVDLQKITFNIIDKILSKDSLTYSTECTVNGIELSDWIFEESLLDDEHCVSVAMNLNGPIKKSDQLFHVLNFDELMENSVPLLKEDASLCKAFFDKEDKPGR